MIENGADMDISMYNGYKLLHHATNNLKEDMVEFLLEKGVNAKAEDDAGNNSLHIASFKGVLSVVNRLVEAGIDVNSTNNANQTPLHKASNLGHISIVKTLLKCGANIDSVDKEGNSPLVRIIFSDHRTLVVYFKAYIYILDPYKFPYIYHIIKNLCTNIYASYSIT